QGIVRTPNNFGNLGEAPSHPELLDFLAREFIRSGWSIKHMHRLMMLSAAYAQSSAAAPELLAADPTNRLFGRAQRRRLDAEQLRDSLLALGGNLDPTHGGPAFEELATPRRTLYLKSVRSGGHGAEFAALFGRPDPSASTALRDADLLAPQALFLETSDFVARQAALLAARVESGDAADPAGRLYRLVLLRDPSPAEREVGRRLLAADPGPDPWAHYCRLLLWTDEFLHID
ncbi:MAG TPA: DUF1553 domain-containing protein, partial [Pirellulales bacterium]|nr:DUF1553 domain-containing protein [Pirellulales bacterium]